MQRGLPSTKDSFVSAFLTGRGANLSAFLWAMRLNNALSPRLHKSLAMRPGHVGTPVWETEGRNRNCAPGPTAQVAQPNCILLSGRQPDVVFSRLLRSDRWTPRSFFSSSFAFFSRSCSSCRLRMSRRSFSTCRSSLSRFVSARDLE